MNLHFTDNRQGTLVLGSGKNQLFEYHYHSDSPQRESPRPYFHPVRTLAGNTVTMHRPTDHPWHHALSMTLTHVSGHNFWGGNTYTREDSYRDTGNQGRQVHTGWNSIEATATGARCEEMLDWITADDARLLRETRCFAVHGIDKKGGCYILDLTFAFENVSGSDLTLGNYHSVEGLAGSHYTGLQFRFAPGFPSETAPDAPVILAAGGLDGEAFVHGAASPWMAIIGQQDATSASSSIVFIDQPGNPGYPNHWFCRSAQTQVAFPFQYTENHVLPTTGHLRLRYRIVIANGAWSRARIETYVAHAPAFHL